MREYKLEQHPEDGLVTRLYVDGTPHSAYYLFWISGYKFLDIQIYRDFFLELFRMFYILVAARLADNEKEF